jgi:deazaflavin-dependent oxidoreductase (nitroreductase family)
MGVAMADADDFNSQVIAEFRANDGVVGGYFVGQTVVLLHHRGRKSGNEFVAPLVYLAGDDDTIYVFASKAGAPENPEWYNNLTAAGTASVEVGTETYPVSVSEVTGAERDSIYAQQVTKMAGFAEYEEKTKGIRTIPVLALKRAAA